MQEMSTQTWNALRCDTAERLNAAAEILGDGKIVAAKDVTRLLEAVIHPGDKVNLEGNNQKQADFLAERLCRVNPKKVHGLHMVQSSIALDSHIKLFEKGIAEKIDFSYAGPQAGKLADAIQSGKVRLGDIHTYLELFGRYFIDLIPRVALVAAYQADRDGNLYTGSNTEDTPVIVEATKFKQGIVIAQVNEIVERVPRVDIPADWVDFVVPSPKPFYLEPLFTRDPALITESQILRAMMALKGIYAEYGVQTVNHGIGFDTAAIELLLPTYGEELGLKGKICSAFALNPHPTLIPAIESGWVKNIHCFGGELGMEQYVRERSDVFSSARTEARDPTAPMPRLRGTMRSICLSVGHCRSMKTETVRPPRPDVSPDSEARRIWAVTPRGGVMPLRHGCNAAGKMASGKPLSEECRAANGWWFSFRKPFAKKWPPDL